MGDRYRLLVVQWGTITINHFNHLDENNIFTEDVELHGDIIFQGR